MITTVFGGPDSGKSAVAEKLLSEFDGNKYYLATMRVITDEDKARVEKHRANRESYGFVTIEQDVAIVKAIDKIKWMDSLLGGGDGPKSVLIECLPRLCANEMFLDSGETVPHKDVESTILCGIALLKEYFENIIIVSDKDAKMADYRCSASDDADEANEYSEAMTELNAALEKLSDKIC